MQSLYLVIYLSIYIYLTDHTIMRITSKCHVKNVKTCVLTRTVFIVIEQTASYIHMSVSAADIPI